jgi:hypothetical protein
MQDPQQDSSTGTEWWQDEPGPASPPFEQRQAPSAAPLGSQARRSSRDRDDDIEDTRGWWERPEERSLQAYSPQALQDWQTERLKEAFAIGRRKANVGDGAS